MLSQDAGFDMLRVFFCSMRLEPQQELTRETEFYRMMNHNMRIPLTMSGKVADIGLGDRHRRQPCTQSVLTIL